VTFAKEIEKQVKEILPERGLVDKVEVEGPEIVLYTSQIDRFMEDDSIIRGLASKLRKHFILRATSEKLMDPEQAEKEIKEIIPPEAEVEKIRFRPDFHEVMIEAKKLGLVIGPRGSTLKEITKRTGWSPRLWRIPTTKSEMMEGIRGTLVKDSRDVKKFLKQVGKNIYREGKKTDWIRLTALGAAREVGRSCFLLETPESKVLLDCGVNVATNDPKKAFPYMSSVDFSLDELDAVIISHGHLDHSGFLPYLFQYGYKGPVYCTPATRDVMALLQRDYVNIAHRNAEDAPYSQKNIKQEIKHCIPREYGEVTDIAPDIRLTLHNAGHILGSSITHLHIGEGAHNLVYTGDMKFGYTELLDPADTNYPRIETLIIESTYGGGNRDVHPPRYVAEKKMLDLIKETIEKNGIVLVPSFAVERAQEIMLIIEKASRENDWDIPVYLDGMIKEASAIHSAYPEYLKKNIKRRILHDDSPFDSPVFQNVDPRKRDDIINEGRSIILSPAGMMSGGPVLEYFKHLSEDERNTLLFVGYQAEGSLGRKIQRGAKEVALEENGKLKQYKVNLKTETIDGLSGHADYNQLLGFYKKLTPKPERVLTVHGEESKCLNLARSIGYKFRVETMSPRNLDSIRLK